MPGMRLHTYWRSSAAYRVRIALNLKQVACDQRPVNLAAGEHRTAEYSAVNPQGLVPALEHDGKLFVQSLAIIEYLDSIFPEPRLIPADPADRARVNAMAQLIACEVHPLNNLRVLNYLRDELGQDGNAVQAWYSHWVAAALAVLETWAAQFSRNGRYVYGGEATLADCCLVPQLYNARRFGVPLDNYPQLRRIDEALRALPAFAAAAPELQPDAA